MTVEERAIEQAAKDIYENFLLTDVEQLFGKSAFIVGAKSPEAKMYWLQKLSEEFESKSDDDTISVIEIVNKVLKSDMTREYHTKRMYSEEEVKVIIKEFGHHINRKYNPQHPIVGEVNEWFEQNKKK